MGPVAEALQRIVSLDQIMGPALFPVALKAFLDERSKFTTNSLWRSLEHASTAALIENLPKLLQALAATDNLDQCLPILPCHLLCACVSAVKDDDFQQQHAQALLESADGWAWLVERVATPSVWDLARKAATVVLTALSRGKPHASLVAATLQALPPAAWVECGISSKLTQNLLKHVSSLGLEEAARWRSEYLAALLSQAASSSDARSTLFSVTKVLGISKTQRSCFAPLLTEASGPLLALLESVAQDKEMATAVLGLVFAAYGSEAKNSPAATQLMSAVGLAWGQEEEALPGSEEKNGASLASDQRTFVLKTMGSTAQGSRVFMTARDLQELLGKLADLRQCTPGSSLAEGLGLRPLVSSESEDQTKGLVLTPTTEINVRMVLDSTLTFRPLLLEGVTGAGKTATVTEAAQRAQRKLLRFNMSIGTTVDDLLGKPELVVDEAGAQRVRLRLSSFARAYTEGLWILLDELNLASDAVVAALEGAIDSGEIQLTDPSSVEPVTVLKMHPDFRILATQNPADGFFKQVSAPHGHCKTMICCFPKLLTILLSTGIAEALGVVPRSLPARPICSAAACRVGRGRSRPARERWLEERCRCNQNRCQEDGAAPECGPRGNLQAVGPRSLPRGRALRRDHHSRHDQVVLPDSPDQGAHWTEGAAQVAGGIGLGHLRRPLPRQWQGQDIRADRPATDATRFH